jgi:hypothetical protein
MIRSNHYHSIPNKHTAITKSRPLSVARVATCTQFDVHFSILPITFPGEERLTVPSILLNRQVAQTNLFYSPTIVLLLLAGIISNEYDSGKCVNAFYI